MRVDRHQPPPRGNRSVPYRVFAHDETGEIALTFFKANAAWLEKQLPVGETVVVSGRMEWFNGRPSMVHPDHIAFPDDAAGLPLVEPVYPLTAGLSPKTMRKAVLQALARLPPALPEWQRPDVLSRERFPSVADALSQLHEPEVPEDLSAQVLPGAASPTTSFSPVRLRSRWSGTGPARDRVGRRLRPAP